MGQGERVTELLALIYIKVCGPFDVQVRGGYSYFIIFIDDLSWYGFIFLMKHKSEVFERFREFRQEVDKQTGKSIKVLRSDRGEKYLSAKFLKYFKENGMVSQWTPPSTPQLNEISEKRNRILLDMIRSMMSFTDLFIYLCGYALLTTMHILNRVPFKSVSTTPYEIWHGKKSNMSYLKTWGCPVYVKK